MTQKPFSSKAALSYGWETMKTSLGLFVPLCLISWFLSALEGALRPGPAGGHGLLALLVHLVNVALAIGWIRICLRLYDHQPAHLTDLLEMPSPLYLNYFLTTLLYGLIVAGGLILLVVPGVYWAIKYSLAPFLVVDQGLAPLPALRRSGELTEGVREDLFVLGLLLLGVNLLGAMALGVGLFATVPATVMALAYVYRRLLQRGGAPHPSAHDVDSRGMNWGAT